MQSDPLAWLRLMQLADSALPIGAMSHSFGLETLVEDGALTVDQLFSFLKDYISETGTLEATYCRAAYYLGDLSEEDAGDEWLYLNMRLDALKMARETRVASATLGRRLLQLAATLEDRPSFEFAQRILKENGVGLHHCTAFGLVSGEFGIDADMAVAAYLQQVCAGLVSACQRLMPLGQTQAARILWELKLTLIEAAKQSRDSNRLSLSPVFALTVETASMRHPGLTTRLFIS
jgi:urease accessory protein